MTAYQYDALSIYMEVLGKLKKFWVFCIDLMTLQKRARTSRERLSVMIKLLRSFYFIVLFFDVYKYTPYGGYYVKISKNIEEPYPEKSFQLVVYL